MGKCKFEIHDFYCMNCGKVIQIPRKVGREKEKLHRKKLYCPYCGKTVNHIEVRNQEEKEWFVEAFAAGALADEAAKSMEVIKNETRMVCLY